MRVFVLLLLACGCACGRNGFDDEANPAPAPESDIDTPPLDDAPPDDEPRDATPRVLDVRDSDELRAALQGELAPGDTVLLEDGDYRGQFVLARSGTAARPIAIKAANPLGAVLSGTLLLAGDDVVASGIHFDGRNAAGTRIVLSGARVTLERSKISRIDSRDDEPGVVVVAIQGVDAVVRYNEFTDIDGRCISGDAAGSAAMQRAHVYRNHFHDYRPAPGNANAREAIQLGQTQQPDGRPVQAPLDAVVEENLFERWNTGGDDENETISVKSCRNSVRANTFVDTNMLSLRFGNDNVVASNWFVTESGRERTGVSIYGNGNVVLANHCATSAGVITVHAGTQSMDAGQGGDNAGNEAAWNGYRDYPYAQDTRVVSNSCALLVGEGDDGGDEPYSSARRTVIEAHAGPIRTQRAYPFSTRDAAFLETGTSYTDAPSSAAAAPVRLSARDVGPGAD